MIRNNKIFILLLMLLVSSIKAHTSEPIMSAVEHFTDDQIVQQLVIAGCDERAIQQLIKAIDASLEARNNSGDEEQEEREWRSTIIKYGLIAAVGVVGIVWIIYAHANQQPVPQASSLASINASTSITPHGVSIPVEPGLWSRVVITGEAGVSEADVNRARAFFNNDLLNHGTHEHVAILRTRIDNRDIGLAFEREVRNVPAQNAQLILPISEEIVLWSHLSIEGALHLDEPRIERARQSFNRRLQNGEHQSEAAVATVGDFARGGVIFRRDIIEFSSTGNNIYHQRYTNDEINRWR